MVLLVGSGHEGGGGEISALGDWGTLERFKALFVGGFIADMVVILSSYLDGERGSCREWSL
jgi:hypothetical protein